MSNHKGGGMASKERLYELWMLYYTKVSASAEEALTLTPVVAAGPPPPFPSRAWSFWTCADKNTWSHTVIGARSLHFNV